MYKLTGSYSYVRSLNDTHRTKYCSTLVSSKHSRLLTKEMILYIVYVSTLIIKFGQKGYFISSLTICYKTTLQLLQSNATSKHGVVAFVRIKVMISTSS